MEAGTPRRRADADPVAALARLLSRLTHRLERLERGQSLRNASISGGALTVKDNLGTVHARVGLLEGSVAGAVGMEVLIGGSWRRVGSPQAGTTAARPATPVVGDPYFDTTLGKPVWCKTASPVVWVDASGVTA